MTRHRALALLHWCNVLLALALLALALTGCWARPAPPAPPQPQEPATTLAGLGAWAVWLGGAGLLLAAVGAVLAPPGLRARVASLAMGAGALIAGGWLLGVIDRWLAVAMTGGLVLAVLAGAAWLWMRRGDVIRYVEATAGVDLPDAWEPVPTGAVERA